MTDAPILEARALSKHFPVTDAFGRRTGAVRAVDEVSFAVAPGSIFGLAGESGSGKSTLARMVMGLESPTSGQLIFDGTDIGAAGSARAHRRDVQMVFQNPGSSLNPRRTVGQSVAVPLVAGGMGRRLRRSRIGELLDMVELPAAFAGRYPHELSGGQRQRVAIARALAVSPRLLVLDEPTSALDVSVQARIIELLRNLGQELGLTYLFISHDLALMRNFVDELAVMYLGKLVESGPVETVFGNPQHAYTRLLLASVPVISAEEEALRPVLPRIDGELPTAEDLIRMEAET